MHDTVYELHRPTREANLEQLPLKVLRMLVLFDGARTAAEVIDLAKIDPKTGQALVKKLTDSGMLVEAGSSREKDQAHSGKRSFFNTKGPVSLQEACL